MPGNRVFLITFEDPAGFAEQLAKAPPEARSQIIENDLDSGLDGTLKAAKQVLGRRKITLGQHSGREFEAELPDGTFLRQRVYSVEGRVYTVGVGGPKAILDSPDAEKFFTSFKLLEPVKPAGQPPDLDPSMHFSVQIPDGWRRFSEEEANITTLVMQLPTRPYAFFRPSGRPTGSFPYVSVTYSPGQQPTLRGLPEMSRKAQADRIILLQTKNPKTEYKVIEPAIDFQRNAVRYATEQHNPDGTVLVIEEAAFPGKTGNVKLSYFHWSGGDGLLWKEMTDSASFDAGYEYVEQTAVPPLAHSDPTMHCSLTIPPGWTEFTKEEMVALAAKMTEAGSSPVDTRIRLSNRSVYSLPYIEVRHQQSKMPTLAEVERQMVAKLRDTKPVVDLQKNCVSFAVVKPTPDAGTVLTKTVVFPCKQGTVQLYFHCPAPELAEHQMAWQTILDSFTFDEGFGYAEPTFVQKVEGHSLLILAGAGVVLAVYVYRRHARTRTVDPMKR